MATDNENGLALFSSLDLTSADPTDKLSQTKNYLANAHLQKSEFSNTSTYEQSAPEDGLGRFQYPIPTNATYTNYVDSVNKDGSTILNLFNSGKGPTNGL